MFEYTIATLNLILVEVLRRNKLARALVLFTAVALAGLTAAAIYVGVTGHTFSGREVRVFDILPVVIGGSVATLWTLSTIIVSLIEPERLKEVIRRSDDNDRLLNALTNTVLGTSVTLSGTAKGSARVRGDISIGPPEKERVSANADDDIIKGIRANLAQLIEYYIMNKSQAKSSFRASLWSIIAGFVAIVVGGIWAYSAERNDLTAYLIPFGGIILQFIGGGYFYMYNRSLIQLNFFFSRLAQMQDTLLAIHLSESLPEAKDRTKAIDRLITIVAERSTTAPAYLTKAPEKRTPARRAKAQPAEAAD
ncbi:TRADD-N-associated membrane domain-containing protein [Rhizobium leguminosarum]|uniref:Putative integral membrane protein n=1 Tax=Rhizobium leguminosarum TaxID=384 RepID=A0A2Z4YC65_RHILE|nr:hypothetical protein [Rhizobium leguminosarum]AXA37893.1 putative integral membrane protein [Rhizobium leguminosarum]